MSDILNSYGTTNLVYKISLFPIIALFIKKIFFLIFSFYPVSRL